MPTSANTIEPARGSKLPTGLIVARLLREFLRRQLADVTAKLRAGNPPRGVSLDTWTRPMVKALLPHFTRWFLQGGNDTAKRIARAMSTHRRDLRAMRVRQFGWDGAALVLRRVRKDSGQSVLNIGFDLYNPRVTDAVWQLVLSFCEATNQTSTLALDDALAQLRTALAAGLEAGDAYADLAKRVRAIFDDPYRAAMIAQTESSRAVHAGGQMAARESKVVAGKSWLASSDACDFCLSLAALGVIDLDANYAVRGKGAYAAIPHPPGHPHCFCTETYELAETEPPAANLDKRLIRVSVAG